MSDSARSEVFAVWADGVLRPDVPLPLVEGTRVRVVVESNVEETEPWDERFQRFFKTMNDHPLHLGGVRFSRDELYERD